MKKAHTYYIFILTLCLILLNKTDILGQDFTDIHKRSPFKLSGYVGAQTQSFLSTDNSFSRPFTYIFNVAVNPTIYGISLPLSISYGSQGFAHTQPFNSLSFTPSYKWIKAYLGRTSMQMSPYGLSGHQFDGAGFELTPKFPISFSVMYGRLNKAYGKDTVSEKDAKMVAYKRMGFASKIGLNIKGQQIGLHIFKAKDEVNSIDSYYNKLVKPKENVVLALDGNFKIADVLSFSFNAAVSELAQDITGEKEVLKGALPAITGIFMKHRNSTVSTAFKVALAFYGVSISYDRVSPFYESLGAYYFSNDFENLVVGYTKSFKKVDVFANVGWQHDDLKKTKQSRMDRVVGSANVNYRINENWTSNLSYSNFITHTKLKPVQLNDLTPDIYEDPDTVAYRQLAQQAQFGFSYTGELKNELKHSFNFSASYQESREISSSNFNHYIYSNLQHSIVLKNDYRINSAVNISSQINRTALDGKDVRFYLGPSIGLNKAFFEKTLSVGMSTNFYFGFAEKSMSDGLFGLNLRASYTLAKAHSFNLQLSGKYQSDFKKSLNIAAKNSRIDFTCNIGYNYKFNVDFAKRKKMKNKQSEESLGGV